MGGGTLGPPCPKGMGRGNMLGGMSIPPGPGKRGKSIPLKLIIFSPHGDSVVRVKLIP